MRRVISRLERIVNHPPRLLRWLTPTIRQERAEWAALRSAGETSKVSDPEDSQVDSLKALYSALHRQSQEFSIPEQHRCLSQLRSRVQVILQRCQLYLDPHPTYHLSRAQIPVLEQILGYIREEQQYIRQQLLLTQSTLHYVKQLKTATEELWSKPFCSPNYLLNLLNKIKHDDRHLTDPGEIVFLSLDDFLSVANLELPPQDLSVYVRGLETARLIYFISRQTEEWQDNVDLSLMAGLLHDFGCLMLKNREQTDPENQTAMIPDERGEHPVLGAALLGGLRGFSGDSFLPEIVSQHHERLDGTGYPRKLHTQTLSDHSRRLAVVSRFLELKNISLELSADGLRTYDVEEAAFAAALQLYREGKRGEWDEIAVDQTLTALDASLLEELIHTDRNNDPFSLKRFQMYRRDSEHLKMKQPHIRLNQNSAEAKQYLDSQAES